MTRVEIPEITPLHRAIWKWWDEWMCADSGLSPIQTIKLVEAIQVTLKIPTISELEELVYDHYGTTASLWEDDFEYSEMAGELALAIFDKYFKEK